VDFLFSKDFISTRKTWVAGIEIILEKISMSTTCVSFYFVYFLIGKVSLSFKETRGYILSLFFLIHSLTPTNIIFYQTEWSVWNFTKQFHVPYYIRFKFHSDRISKKTLCISILIDLELFFIILYKTFFFPSLFRIFFNLL
jgi:hypothetical protein